MQCSIPRHVAVIMDGNGRWGKKKSLTRSHGHYAGAQAMEKVIDASIDCGIEALTLYAFSSENWSRSKEEVNYLMRLPVRFFKRKLPGFMKRNIKIMLSGNIDELPKATKKVLLQALEQTKNNDGLIVNFAFNYGGRGEIVRAAQKMLQQAKKENLEVSEELFQHHLYTNELPELELVIRTGGEQRLSNFLLWQSANAELYFCDTYFPDFTGEDFKEVIYKYQTNTSEYALPEVFSKAH